MKDVSMFKLGFLFTLGAMAASIIVWIGVFIVLGIILSQQS